jgi:hypothetical protein
MKKGSQKLAGKEFAALVAILFLFVISIARVQGEEGFKYEPGGTNRAAKEYYHPPDFPDYPKQAIWLGELSGTWYQMGVQYGERVPADLITSVFDGWVQTWTPEYEKPPFPYLKESLKRYEKQAAYYAPELLEMMKGLAVGAGPKLDKSRYAEYFTNYEKVLFINWHTSVVWRHPSPPKASQTKQLDSPKAGSRRATNSELYEGCSAFAAGPGATKDGKTYATQNRDIPFFPWAYEVAYVARPSDPKANRFWSLCSAGQLIGIHAVNDKGLSVSHNTSYVKIKDRDFGVPWTSRILHAVIYCDNRDDAIQMVTLGTPEYRAATGRKTLLRDGNSNTTVADRKSCAVVEVTAHWYAVRYPGDMGEVGNYVAVANHFKTKSHCYDENNVRHEGEGMTKFGDFKYPHGSECRWLTLMALLKENFGRIDEKKAFQLMSSHSLVNKDGEIVDYVWNAKFGWIPAQFAPDSPVPCRHEGKYPETFWGSTNDTKIAGLHDNIVYWTLGRPCEWVGPLSSLQWLYPPNIQTTAK